MRRVVAGIYSITHSSGRVYIGSSKDVDTRLCQHRISLEKGNHHNRFLQRTWNRYSSGDFTFSLLEEIAGPFEDLLTQREQFYIDWIGSDYLFNIGKYARCPWLGMPQTEVQRRKLSEARRGKPHPYTDIQREKIIASNKRRKGEKHSAAAIAKMSAAAKGQKHPPTSLETREKMRKYALKRTYSQETRAKMSASAKARKNRPKLTPERIAHLNASRQTPKAIENKRLGLQVAWALNKDERIARMRATRLRNAG